MRVLTLFNIEYACNQPKHEIKPAQALKSGDILQKFVDEMHRWTKACAEVLRDPARDLKSRPSKKAEILGQ